MAQPMNASSSHPKVKVSLTLGKAIYVAGGNVTGKLEMECRADQGLGISAMRVELFAIQELTSRDHTTRSIFLHTEQLYQGPGLPPSNAVQPHPMPGDPPLPQHYHQARRGVSTFLVRFPLPVTSPSSINFGNNLAKVRYELRAGVQVYWKGEKRLVTDVKEINVVEAYFDEEEPVGQVVGENGKIWVQGRVIGGVVVVGETACVELQVKNHSSKRNNGLSISLNRQLHLPGTSQKSPILISDTLTTVPFRGPEYIIPPGAEGVASLVFDVPRNARGARGGLLEGDHSSREPKESLFEVQCFISVKMSMGLASKDLTLDLPVHLVHPNALPPPAEVPPYGYPDPQAEYQSISPIYSGSPPPMPYLSPSLPMSPAPYVDSNYVWFPPPNAYQYPQYSGSPVYLPPPIQDTPPRPISAGGRDRSMLPLDNIGVMANVNVDPEEGKGERASRITHHLRLSSRTRSVSPQSHRYPMVQTPAKKTLPIPPPISMPSPTFSESQQSPVLHSPRPVLTPKQSFNEHIDMLTSRSLPKSERVEDLERMADEVAKKAKDLSSDIPPSTILSTAPTKAHADINKTLPGPPAPSRKLSASLLTAARPMAQDYFASTTPPTPTLAATRTKSKMSNGGESHKVKSIRNPTTLVPDTAESGLDALERKLLAQVGTRKVDDGNAKPDVRTVLPIAIPPKSADPDESLNDSAISSLSLAEALDKQDQDDKDADSDGKTHKGKSSTVIEEKASKSDGEKRLQKKKSKEGDARKMRKAAKGKVAAWLNAVEPDVPPVSVEVPSASPAASLPDIEPLPDPQPLPDIATLPGSEEPTMEELLATEPPLADPPPIPNARSSGFVPIGSLRRDALGRSLVPVNSVPAEESKRVADLWSSPPTSNSGDLGDSVARNPWNTSKAATGKLKPPTFPEKPDPEVKYDYRSARGGRGGQVTAVASLWAKSQQPQAESIDASPRGRLPRIQEKKSLSGTTTPTIPARRPPPLKKSIVPPALVSSSHAKPTISSTASLARPISLKPPPALKHPPTISEFPSAESTRVKTSLPKSPIVERPTKRGTSAAIEGLTKLNNSSTGSNAKPEMAFGQARLRDLIRKYQGGANAS